MNKKVSLGVAITVVILAVALTVSATMVVSMRHFSSMVNDVGQRQAMYEYIDEIDSSARRYYTIDEEKLRAALAKGYVDGLGDPYAQYLSATEYKSIQSRLAGNRTGFGFSVTVSQDNQLVISTVDRNSPAELSGIREGDILTVLDGEEMNGSLYNTVQGKLSAAKISLSVSHDGLVTALELASNTYTAVSVESRMLDDTIGYIAIQDFNNLTPLQFKNAYSELTKNGAAYFVFDVRNNQGGSLEAAKEILDYLLPRGPYMNCETKTGISVFTAGDTYEISIPTVTLVNGNTVGEAELFAAALQGMSKTVVVGTSTEGKAVAQEYFSIDSDKAAVRLTVGKFSLLQDDQTWMDTGVYPDHMVDLPYDKLLYFDLLTDAEDTQIQRAVEVLKNSNIVSQNNSGVKVPTTTATGTTTTTAAATTTTKKK